MLARRGIDTVLCFGVGRAGSQLLSAHAWLRVGDRIVVGAERAPEFTRVVEYPFVSPTENLPQ